MARKILVTGGAGFIGTNYVSRLLDRGEEVILFDNLFREGTPRNLAWLEDRYGSEAFEFIQGDVRDADLLEDTARNVDAVLHLAAQVAVTTSVIKPREDFEINALGTFNVLEAARRSPQKPPVLFASTNKVYGELEDLEVEEGETRYRFSRSPEGVAEDQLLDFHSPYGCSKGAADQYVRDYHRMYDLPTVVFRQSCIYGPHQFGIEDQGWVAWFVIAAVTGKPITIYGDGKQVRDLLFVEDLLDAYDLALENIDQAAGQIYNLGGGKDFSLSIWQEFGPLLEQELGKPIPVLREGWRPGDQQVFIADIRKAERDLGWRPKVDPETGIRQLFDWVRENRDLFN
ncbi:MAG: GDP-mannose 4,6-dehydratase [Anaerolineales bacterium]|nr:GDP-mannose 4,6-dehydratase [Anaerolineales bacterium]